VARKFNSLLDSLTELSRVIISSANVGQVF
jgi:hypothetical protein